MVFFGKKLPPVKAVDGISFSIKPGNVLVLAGESGSGKSTIARLILGAEEADSGTIRFGGNKVDYATGDGVGEIRAGCQMVHQNPYDSVNPRMHVSDIIAEPLQIHHWKGDKKERVLQVLREVKMEPAEEIAAMYPHQLSMRVESKLLRTHANDIAKYTASTMRLVELGSGASIKTQIILDAMGADARPIEYMPVDISKVIGENCMYLLDAYDEITVKGIVDTYEKGLELVKNLDHTPSLIAFLGSSLGNMNPEIALEFLRTVRSCMRKGDLFLIGLDLNKSADILHAAYDDACGITAKFNKNILHRINSELGADFDLEQFEHHVVYDEKQMRVGMYLKSMQRQTVSIPKSGIRTVFEKDEMIHTENSFKYTPDSIKLMLSQAGLKIENMWCDDDKMFSLTLASLKD